jgi:class 3 adenylate cyclase
VADIHYAASGDLSIAYRAYGTGPPDVLFVPGFVSHVELNWEIPAFRLLRDQIAAFARFITFDKRGTGLSDRTLGTGLSEERMDDIRAVLDAIGVEQAAVLGVSEGGPLAIQFTASHPDRVSHLVLYGTFARQTWADDYVIGVDPARFEPILDRIRSTWGTGWAVRLFVELPEDDTELGARLERNSATPKDAIDLLRAALAIDVRAALPAIDVPTAVVHTRHDPAIPSRFGRYLANHIRGARYVEIDSEEHASPADVPELVATLEELVTGARHDPVVDRVLATVLFTDVVQSTATAAHLGDQRWVALLDRHDAIVRSEVDRARGRVVKTTGDGVLATFDGPARAIRCARAIVARAGELGLQLRAGIHAGECELRGTDVAGLTVHIAARVAALAGAGEVLVSGTVRDLLLGSGIGFDDRGRHELKGVPGHWPVLAVS